MWEVEVIDKLVVDLGRRVRVLGSSELADL